MRLTAPRSVSGSDRFVIRAVACELACYRSPRVQVRGIGQATILLGDNPSFTDTVGDGLSRLHANAVWPAVPAREGTAGLFGRSERSTIVHEPGSVVLNRSSDGVCRGTIFASRVAVNSDSPPLGAGPVRGLLHAHCRLRGHGGRRRRRGVVPLRRPGRVGSPGRSGSSARQSRA